MRYEMWKELYKATLSFDKNIAPEDYSCTLLRSADSNAHNFSLNSEVFSFDPVLDDKSDMITSW